MGGRGKAGEIGAGRSDEWAGKPGPPWSAPGSGGRLRKQIPDLNPRKGDRACGPRWSGRIHRATRPQPW